MQHASGLSGGALERLYIGYIAPQRLGHGTRKPDAFSRYLKVEQVPWGENSARSPVRWALEHHAAFAEAYRSPLFELLQLGDTRDELIAFTRALDEHNRISADLISQTMRKSTLAWKRRFYTPLWSTPKDVLALRRIVKLDALCLILVALKASASIAHERQALAICSEWLQEWSGKLNPHEKLRDLMLQTLAEHVPCCQFLMGDKWRTFKVDLSDPCFAQSPAEAMREAHLKLLLPPRSSRDRLK